MTPIEKVDQFLSEAGTFFLATEDGTQPKCRPISFHMLEDDTIWFGVGTFKEVYRQMLENPNVEFCACIGGKFLRYFGEAQFTNDPAYAEKAFEVMPGLRGIYNEETGYKFGIFKLVNATAEFRGLLGVEESYQL